MIKRVFPYLFLILLVHLIDTSCSRRVYPVAAFSNIEGNSERRMLTGFLGEGVEKNLNTGSTTAGDIIAAAAEYLGVPHCMGGKTAKCMDCSGLLVAVFARHNIHLPHNSEEQARFGRIMTGPDELQEGDLVFFVRSYRTNRLITHSGIYAGNSQFIHASSSRGVTITSLNDPWWSERFVFGTRVFD